MMKEHVIYSERKNTDCEKWDGLREQYGREDLLPVWVADMDFEAPKCVKRALKDAVDRNVYGYYRVPDSYYEAIMDWEKKYQGYEIKREWIRFIPGVVPAIYWLVQKWAKSGESVCVMPPVYYPFLNSIKETGRKLVECPLVHKSGRYEMNLELFERQIQEEDVKVFILCSPHNPVGRVWKREELKAVLDICKKHHVYVIADEIHQDIVVNGNQKITAATVGDYNEILVTLTSASKSFNLAGFQNAYIIIPDEKIREEYDELARYAHFTEGSMLSYIAVRAAYTEGREWLESVLDKIEENYHILKRELEEKLPEAVLTPLEGTYLAWVDLSAYIEPERTVEVILDQCHLAVDFGEWFGGKEYQSFVRINLATSSENVQEVVKRLEKINL